MNDLASLRDVRVEKSKGGYKLKGLDESYVLKPQEALTLLESLLRKLPEVSDGIRASWELRDKPYVKIRVYYEEEDGQALPTWYQGEIYVRGRLVRRTQIDHISEAQALEKCRSIYGRDDLEVRDVYDCPGSKRMVLENIKMKEAERLMEEMDLSVGEFMKLVEAGEIEGF